MVSVIEGSSNDVAVNAVTVEISYSIFGSIIDYGTKV